MKGIIQKCAIGLLGLLAFIATSGTASAFVQFNNDPQDFATFRVSNATACNNCSNWAQSATANAGDVVAFSVYYHNTGNETAQNVRIKVTPQVNGPGTSESFTGQVISDNAGTVSGTNTVYISTVQTMTYIPGSARWFANQSASGVPINDAALFSSGIPVGNIAAGWPSQGQLRVQYQVGQTAQASTPIVATNSATNIAQYSATLNGNISAGAPVTSKYFKWGTSASNLSQTLSLGSQSANGAFSGSISGLTTNTTYYFQACAVNSAGSGCGSVLSFQSGAGQQTYQCNDGNDNDFDGLTDYGQDPGCTSATDNDEYNQITNNIPTVTTNDATSVDENSATLNAYTDPNGTTVTRFFKWGTSSSNMFNTVYVSGSQSSSGSFDDSLSGLNDDTTYYFQACVTPSGGSTVCNGTKSFHTDTVGSTGNEPDVTTLSATSIDIDSATLEGDVDTNGDAVTRWFEWGTSSGNLSHTLSLSGSQSNDGNFDKFLSGLAEDETYYFRACAENSFGSDCGVVKNFQTDTESTDNGGDADVEDMHVVTLPATTVTQADARLNGLVANNTSQSATGWFEWGTNPQMSFRTPDISLGSDDSVNFWTTVSSLNPNTTYYFRAVVKTTNGLEHFGTIQTFHTTGITPPNYIAPVRTVYVNSGTGGGTGNSLMMLTIDSRYENVYVGDMIDYTVTYKNISGHTLNNSVLRITFPVEVAYRNGSAGSYSAGDRTVTIVLGTVVPNQTATYTFQGQVLGIARDNQLLVTTASLVFTEWHGAQEEATAYELNTVQVIRGGGFSLFGGFGFLPNSLIEWLIIILIIFGIVYLARKAFRDDKKS